MPLPSPILRSLGMPPQLAAGMALIALAMLIGLFAVGIVAGDGP